MTEQKNDLLTSTALVVGHSAEVTAAAYATAWLDYVKKYGEPKAAPYLETLFRVHANDISVYPQVHELLKAALHPGAPAVEGKDGKRGRKAIPRGSHAELTENKRWSIDCREALWAKDLVDKVAKTDLDAITPEIGEIEEAVATIEALINLSDAAKASYAKSLRDASRMNGVMQGKTRDMLMLIEKVVDAAERHDTALGAAKREAEWQIAQRERQLQDERIALANARVEAAVHAQERAEAMQERLMLVLERMTGRAAPPSQDRDDLGAARGNA